MQINKEGLILLNDWTDFCRKLSSLISVSMSEEEICKVLGLDFTRYSQLVEKAIWGWKSSPSKSFLNGLQKIGSRPQMGEPIFNTLVDQTRFLMLAREANYVPLHYTTFVRDAEEKPIIVKNAKALTLKDIPEAEKSFLTLLQMLFVYQQYRKEQLEAKALPKVLYRGVRFRNVVEIKALEPQYKQIPKGIYHYDYWKQKVDIFMEYLKENGLGVLYQDQFVSFTASKSIAEYFCNGDGFVVTIPTEGLQILTSELQDERFREKDNVSGRKEREYIVQIGKDAPRIENIFIWDEDYLIATQNPLAVNLFHHDNKEASYELNGIRIEAWWSWSSNTQGHHLYRPIMEGVYGGYGSGEFARIYGFNPKITKRNIKEVKDFTITIKR